MTDQPLPVAEVELVLQLLMNEESTPAYHSLALLISEETSLDKVLGIVKEILPEEEKRHVYQLSRCNESECGSVMSSVIRNYVEGTLSIIELGRDIPLDLLSLLIIASKDKAPERGRFLILTERHTIENDIGYPNFYTLFNPVVAV